MDNSISKALIMVAGLLLAMIVVGFMTFTLNRTGTWATAQDDEKLIKQKDEFNREYEAYDKDLMYGVDVISCLNKAKSNNDQITDKSKINGENYDQIYEINVKFELKKALKEAVRVYHTNDTGKQVEYQEGIDAPDSSKVPKMNDIFEISDKYKSKIQGGSNSINFSKQLGPNLEGSTKINVGTYNLVGDKKDLVEALMTCSDEVKQTKKNDGKKSNPSETDSWTMAVWETALYDLKTRKFTCKEIKYNETTGRVNYIYFEEIR